MSFLRPTLDQLDQVISAKSFQPLLEGKDADIDYDSGAESDDADEDDDEDPFEEDDPFSNAPPPAENLDRRMSGHHHRRKNYSSQKYLSRN